jgi:hypothetical protein
MSVFMTLTSVIMTFQLAKKQKHLSLFYVAMKIYFLWFIIDNDMKMFILVIVNNMGL